VTDSAPCQKCGAAVDAGAQFCSKCGVDVTVLFGGDDTLAMTAVGGSGQAAPVRETVRQTLRVATTGEYEINEELGRGGMATVFLARDLSLDRKVAIKVMAPHLLEGEGMAERFKLEARTAAQLSHPHIIPIYAVKETEDTLFFVMKFIEGRGLDEIIKKTGQLPIPMVKDILIKVGSALAYAHRRDVVHRDIKPANVMIDEEGTPVVTDYGIAKVAEMSGLTMTGTTIGTPSYMSPEQCEAKTVTGASDQYSLGVVAFEMLTGKLPFSGDSAVTIMYRHCHEELPPLQDFRPDCPPEVIETVTRMLAKDPADRWPTLDAAMQKLGTQTHSVLDPVRSQLMELARESGSEELIARLSDPSLAVDGAVTTGGARTAGTASAGGGAARARRSRAVMVGVASVAVVGIGSLAILKPWAEDTPPTLVENTGPADGADGAADAENGLPAGGAEAGGDEGGGAPERGQPGGNDPGGNDPDGNDAAGNDAAGNDAAGGTGGDGGRGDAGVDPTTPGAGTPTTGADAGASPTTTQVAVREVRLSRVSGTIEPGDGVTLTATAIDFAGATVPVSVINACSDHGWSQCGFQWASSDENVATVGTNGTLLAVGPGRAMVSVTVGGVSSTEAVTVVPAAVAALRVSPSSLSMVVGENAELSAEPRGGSGSPLSGRDVSWSVRDDGVVSVDQSGVVRALSAGRTTITVASGDVEQSVSVDVEPAPIDTRTAIEALIRTYVEALESREVENVRAVNLGLTPADARSLQGTLDAMEDLDVDLAISSFEDRGDTVIAGITGAYRFRADRSEQQLPVDFTATFERVAEGWQMREIRAPGEGTPTS
jgi:Protein kinase domain/Bacterial Ig-like domain (group 2)